MSLFYMRFSALQALRRLVRSRAEGVPRSRPDRIMTVGDYNCICYSSTYFRLIFFFNLGGGNFEERT